MVEKQKNYKDRQKSNLDELNARYGKLPPQALDVEEAVLGALMLERETYQVVSGYIDTLSFYKEAHQKIFETIKSVVTKNKPVDLLTVTQELKDRGILDEVGGPAYITQLTSRVASVAHIEFYARIIAQKFIQREMIRISSEIQSKSYDDSLDVDDLFDFTRSELNAIDNFITSANPGQITEVVAKNALHDIDADAKAIQAGISPGISSGISDLDRALGGWRNTNLVILAARPGVGKTSFALHLAVTAARQGKWVNFYGLEMKNEDLFRILLSGETDIPRSNIRDGRLDSIDWEKINVATGQLEPLTILWNDYAGTTVAQIKANTTRNKKAGKCDIVIIDYLQLMKPTDKKAIREQQIADMTRTLKETALSENIPVICLSQLNREVEKRTDKEPNLSDLRESGAIEQDADVVLFLYENDGLHLKIGKNRRGKRGKVNFQANEEKTQFTDVELQYSIDMTTNETFEEQPF